MSKIDFDYLNCEADITKLAGIPEPTSKARSTRGLELHSPCPLCQDGKDRFWINVENKPMTWRCRQCGKGGDAMQYIAEREHLDRRIDCVKIAEMLACESGLSLYAGGSSLSSAVIEHRPVIIPKPKEQMKPAPAADWQKAAMTFIESSERNIKIPGNKGLEYMTKQRGLTAETLASFRIGYNPAWYQCSIDKRKYSLLPGIVIPVIEKDIVWRVKIRANELYKGNRYISMTGSAGDAIFNKKQGKISDVLLLAEGEIDCMTVTQEAGDLIGCATIGSCETLPEYSLRNLETFYLPDLIMICYDNDDAGQAGAAKMQQYIATKYQTETIIKRLPEEYNDFNNMHTQGGSVRDLITKWLYEAGIM